MKEIGIALLVIGIIMFFFRIRKSIDLKKIKIPALLSKDDPKSGGKTWPIEKQASVIIVLLTALVIALFWTPIKGVFNEYPLVILGIAIAIAIMLIGGNPEKTIRKVRAVALITLIGSFLIFIIWPAYIAPTIKQVFNSPAKKEVPINQSQPKKFNSTGIILAPGDSLRVTKDSSSPAISLILKLSDGEEREYPASNWGTRTMTYLHTHPIMRNRSAAVLYEGDAGKYYFEKNPANPNSPAIVPAIYHPPSAPPTPTKVNKQKQAAPKPAPKDNCPFE